MFDIGTYNVLRSAIGASTYRQIPLPQQWDPLDCPHVALVESTGDRVFSFLLSQPTDEDGEIWVRNLDFVEDGSVIEVKHSRAEYKYYRRDGEFWAIIAEKKDPFFVDVYQRGAYPLTVPTLDDNWSALD